MRASRLLLATCTASLAASSLAAAQARTPVEVVWCTAGSEPTHELLSVTGAMEIAPDTLWVADARAGVVVEFSGAGSVRRVAARSGDGPGEVRAPYYLLALPGRSVGVYDVQRSSVEVFSPEGRFLRRIPLAVRLQNVKGVLGLPDGRIVMSGGITGNPHTVHVFDATGRLTWSWFPAPVTQNPRAGIMVGGGALASATDGSLWFSRAAPHLIARVGIGSAAADTLAVDDTLIPAIGDEFISETIENGQLIRSFRWFFPQSRFVMERGGQLLNVVWRHDARESIWELYDIAARRRVSLAAANEAWQVWNAVRDNSLLASRIREDTGQHEFCRLRYLPR